MEEMCLISPWSRKLELRDREVESKLDIAAFVNGSRRHTERLLDVVDIRVEWNRTCAIGGEVSLCDRRVASWREACDYLECSRQTIVRYFGRGLGRLRFSDLEAMKISRGGQCVYRQVACLEEMEDFVEGCRECGRVGFAWVAFEDGTREIFTRALWAALRSGRDLVGFESEVECGSLTEPYGRFERASEYLGDRRKVVNDDIGALQRRMMMKKWAKMVLWSANIDHLFSRTQVLRQSGREFFVRNKCVFFGGNSLVLATHKAAEIGCPMYVFGEGSRLVLPVLGIYLGCLRTEQWVGLYPDIHWG